MKRKPMPPRNHVVVAMLKRKAGGGAHGKTVKAQRRLDKIELQGCVTQRQSSRLLTDKARFRNSPHPPSTKTHSKECFSVED